MHEAVKATYFTVMEGCVDGYWVEWR